MTPDSIDEPNPYSERYDVSLTLLGAHLKPGELAIHLRRKRPCDVWRAGDVRGGRRRTSTPGIRVQIADTAQAEAAVQAVEEFVATEGAFLRAARSLDDDLRAVMSCALWVYATVPTTIVLPHSVLRHLAELEIDWEVTGYPCSDDEEREV